MIARSSTLVLACRDTLAAGRFDRLRPGIRGGLTVSYDVAPVPLPAAPDLPTLHAEQIARAWSEGAQDVVVDLHTALDELVLWGGHVLSAGEWSRTPARLRAPWLWATRGGRLVTWSWLPCVGADPTRIEAGRRADPAIDGRGRREGSPPNDLRRPDWRRRWKRYVIRLDPGREARRAWSPRATERQRACIMALRRATGVDVGAPLPARLTIAEASAMIDQLRAVERGEATA